MVPVTRRGLCTRSRAWPEEAGVVAFVLAGPAPVDEAGGGASADRADDEQAVRHTADVATAASRARRKAASRARRNERSTGAMYRPPYRETRDLAVCRRLCHG